MISFALRNSLILMGNLKEWYNSSSCIIVGCMCWAGFFVQFVFASCTLGCGQPAFIYWSFAFMTSIQRVNGSDRYIFYRQPFNQFDFPFKFTHQQTKTKCQWQLEEYFSIPFASSKQYIYRNKMIKKRNARLIKAEIIFVLQLHFLNSHKKISPNESLPLSQLPVG